MHPLSYTFDAIVEEKAKRLLQREVSLLRELLSNIQEEGLYPPSKEKKRWEKVMQDRFFLLEGIKELRKAREGMQWKDPSHEFVFLIEQVIALIERIDAQNKYNERQQKIAIAPIISYPIPQVASLSKKSGVIAVL